MNSQEYNDEFKLKTEINQLKEQLSQMTKVRITTEDYKDLINKMQELIVKYEEKVNKRQLQNKRMQDELDPVKNYEKQIKYYQLKKTKSTANASNQYFTDLYYHRLLPASHNKDIIIREKDNALLSSHHSSYYSTLLDRVSSEFQFQKFFSLNHLEKETKLQQSNAKKAKANMEYIDLFNQIIEEIENKIEYLLYKDNYEVTMRIKEKCLDEFRNLNKNTMEELTSSGIDLQNKAKTTLSDFINMALVNLNMLAEKIRNFQVNSASNKFSIGLFEKFNKNIILASQNCYLMDFILNILVTSVYNSTIEGIIEDSNSFDFNEIKSKIDDYKRTIEERDSNNKGYIFTIHEVNKANTIEDNSIQSGLYSEDELN